MRRFLQFIVTETLAGNAGRLCEYTIATSVFERDQSFEPGLDPIVRNDAPGYAKSCLIEIPKGSYVPVFTPGSCRRPRAGRQYRLTITLVRIADGAEVWTAEHEY